MSGAVMNQDLGTCIYTPLPELPKAYESHTVPLQTLVAMSKMEHTLRLNDPALQVRFKAASRDAQRPAGGKRVEETRTEEQTDIIQELQSRVLAQYGYATCVGTDDATGQQFFAEVDELALYELRTAAFQYPDEPAFQETVYFKYNRAGDIPLKDGETGQDCTLFTLDRREELSLFQYLATLTAEEVAELAAVKQAGGDVQGVIFPRVIASGSYT